MFLIHGYVGQLFDNVIITFDDSSKDNVFS